MSPISFLLDEWPRSGRAETQLGTGSGGDSQPSGGGKSESGGGGSRGIFGLSRSDKIAIVASLSGSALTVIGIVIAWKAHRNQRRCGGPHIVKRGFRR